jgi:tetratricopeptide (TPR) repeat protein
LADVESEDCVSGLEGPAFGIAGKAGLAALKLWAASSEFDRLCERLAARFGEQTGFSAAAFADWGKNEPFMLALAAYLVPPHEFDRDALIEAITPLVGPLEEGGTPEEFAAAIADAIREEMREAKTGDALVRFEIDRVLAAGAQKGRLAFDWAPARTRSGLERLAQENPTEARALQGAFEGKDIEKEIISQIRAPQMWLKDGSAALWREIAVLAEVVGCWVEAQKAWEIYAELPTCDRVRGLHGAAEAAGRLGELEAAKALRARAVDIDPDHELVLLSAAVEIEDPTERLAALEEIPDPQEGSSEPMRKALIAMALTDGGRFDEAGVIAQEALALGPDDFRSREAVAASILARNIQLHKEGTAVDRTELSVAAEHYRALINAMRESRRHQEAGGLRAMLGQCELLAGRHEETKVLIAEVSEQELLGEVPVELAGLSLAVGDSDRVEELLDTYEGDSRGARLLRARADLLSGERSRGLVTLDQGIEEGDSDFAAMRLVASIVDPEEIEWSEAAESLLRAENPVRASQFKADWHEQRGEPEAARRALAKHANDPRSVRALMLYYTDKKDWTKAAPQAARLLELESDLDVQVAAGQVLRHAGREAEAEVALRGVFDHPDASEEERQVAFDELADMLLRSGRFDHAGRLAEAAEKHEVERAPWLKGHSLALSGRTEEAFALVDGLEAKTEVDENLLVNLIFSHETPRRALDRLIEIADRSARPDEELEVLITRSLLSCDPSEVTPALVERAGPVQFVQRFPSSKRLWKERVPEGDEEMLEKLRDLTQGRAEASAMAEMHIFEQGDWPVGALAIAIGKSLGETWGVLARLPIRYAGGERDAAEFDAAQTAAGGPVLFETSALCVLSALPESVVAAILAEFPQSERVLAVTADLLRTKVEEPGGKGGETMTVGWDLAQGRPMVATMSAEDAAMPGRRAQQMLELSQRLKTATRPVGEGTSDGRDTSEIAEVYGETIAVARAAGRAVYSDDRCFRALLQAEGIETFGTIALLQVLEKSQAISREHLRDAFDALRERGGTVGPWDEGDGVHE